MRNNMTIETDNTETSYMTDDDIVNAMVGSEEDTPDVEEIADEPEIEEEIEEQEEVDEDEENEGDEDGSDDNVEDTSQEDPETQIKIGDEVKTFKHSELAQLVADKEYLQTIAPSVKREVAIANDVGAFVMSAYDSMYQKAKADVDAYEAYDEFDAYRTLSPEQFENFKNNKKAAKAALDAVTHDAQNYIKNMQAAKVEILREQAKQALPEITRRIPEWNDNVYKELQTFAISTGMDVNVFNEITDPSAIEIIHMAYKYKKANGGSSKVVKKEVKAPSNVVKKSTTTTTTPTSTAKKAAQKAFKTHDDEDILAFMLANKE